MQPRPEVIVAAIREAVASKRECIWVMQTGENWFLDPGDQNISDGDSILDWGRARKEIDSVLLAALIKGDVQYVRRAVLYDVSSDAGDRTARPRADKATVHRNIYVRLAAWKQELARYIALFDDGTSRYPIARCTAPLSVQEVILGRVTTQDEVDNLVRTGELDGCIATDGLVVPEPWARIARMISMHGNLGLPAEDADPLAALPALELSEYRRR